MPEHTWICLSDADRITGICLVITAQCMKKQRLYAVEHAFLSRYPGGFNNNELVAIGKKHQITRRHEQALACFAPAQFATPQKVAFDMVTQISRSSMVSMFEKPRLKDWVNIMSDMERESYAMALYEILHGDEQRGFTTMCSLLSAAKVAKWPLMTILPYYYAVQRNVFIKPTTTKKIIAYFELEGLNYRPLPDYTFYRNYSDQILAMKSMVDPSLQIDNAAFTGFLMMALQGL